MNTNLELDHGDARTMEVEDEPIQLRLPSGSAIFVTRGEAWITQERRLDDFIVGPNERFDVLRRDPLVISATRGRVQMLVVAPAVARRHPQRDVYDFVRSRGAELRRQARAGAGGRLLHAARVGVARLRAAMAAEPRVPTH